MTLIPGWGNNTFMKTELRLPENDNKKLANLCGVLNENIAQISAGLAIEINRKGALFTFSGQKKNIELGSQLVESFYARASRSISPEDIQLSLVEVNKIDKKDMKKSPQLITLKDKLQGRTPMQIDYLNSIQKNDINFGIGPAGTGKTFLAVASAVDALNREKVKRIVLVRPAVEAGERLGFLPGDLTQKVDPYLRPLYDALYDLAGYDNVTRMFDKGILEVAPLAYMRGRTLNQSFIILDEAQNTTPEQMKMFLTRIGFGTKAVITGDVTQIDLAKNQLSGLIEIQKILKSINGIQFINFTSADVVRHPLVQKIINAYEKFDSN